VDYSPNQEGEAKEPQLETKQSEMVRLVTYDEAHEKAD